MKAQWIGTFFALALWTACDAKSSAGGSSSAASGSNARPPATISPSTSEAPKPGSVTISALGLTVDAPADAKVTEVAAGSGIFMVKAKGFVVSLFKPDKADVKTADAAKKEAEMTKPTNMKDEKLGDGYLFTYEGDNGGKRGFFVESRREIGGVTISCGSTTESEAEQQTTVAACKSLMKI